MKNFKFSEIFKNPKAFIPSFIMFGLSVVSFLVYVFIESETILNIGATISTIFLFVFLINIFIYSRKPKKAAPPAVAAPVFQEEPPKHEPDAEFSGITVPPFPDSYNLLIYDYTYKIQISDKALLYSLRGKSGKDVKLTLTDMPDTISAETEGIFLGTVIHRTLYSVLSHWTQKSFISRTIIQKIDFDEELVIIHAYFYKPLEYFEYKDFSAVKVDKNFKPFIAENDQLIIEKDFNDNFVIKAESGAQIAYCPKSFESFAEDSSQVYGFITELVKDDDFEVKTFKFRAFV